MDSSTFTHDSQPHVVVWIDVRNGREQQWVLRLCQDDAHDVTRPPISDIVRFTNTGRVLRYKRTDGVWLRATWWGPIEPPAGKIPAPHVEIFRADREFLRLGFAGASEDWLELARRWNDLRRSGEISPDARLDLRASVRPFGPLTEARTRALANRLGLLQDEEWTMFAVEPALESLAGLAIADQMGAKLMEFLSIRPSWWSVVSHMGVEHTIVVAPAQLKRVGAEQFDWPFDWLENGQPALRGHLVVGPPAGSRWLCAGILEVRAQTTGQAHAEIIMRMMSPL